MSELRKQVLMVERSQGYGGKKEEIPADLTCARKGCHCRALQRLLALLSGGDKVRVWLEIE